MESQTALRDWTVLLVGGNSGAGKTTVAQRLGQIYGVSVAQVDDFRLVLQRVTSASEYPDLHFFLQPNVVSEYTPAELCQRLIRVGQIMSDALEIVVAHHVVTRTPLILEGDGIVPALAAQRVFDNCRVPNDVHAIFLIEADQEQLLRNQRRPGRGDDIDQDESERWVALSSLYGQWMVQEAQKHTLPAISAQPWATVIERMQHILAS